jgi:hypothetical protein
MPSAVEAAVDTYIRAWMEPDATRRAQLLERCFAADGRFLTRVQEIRGRQALAAFMTHTLAAPQLLRIVPPSAVDAVGKTFRFRAVAELRDGTRPETFEAGEIDATGQICTILTFSGPF